MALKYKGYHCWDSLSSRLRISRHVTFWEHKIFSTISSFQVTETLTPLFINPNVSLFPNDILADGSFSSLSQPTASTDESPPVVEPIDSSTIIPYSLPVCPLTPLRRTSCVSCFSSRLYLQFYYCHL